MTGASGFIGRHLVRHLAEAGWRVIAGVRRVAEWQDAGIECTRVNLESPDEIDRPLLSQVNCVIHLAGLAHQRRASADLDARFDRLNARATASLAKLAAAAGVKRFVFVSSIKVNGECTKERPFSADDVPAPQDAYGRSKLAAEQALRDVARETGLEVAIVRPPLVYGPGVSANFAAMMRAVQASIPLPLGAARNLRSLVNVYNLASFLETLATHPAAVGRVWLVSDGQDISVPDLIGEIARCMGRRARVIAVPVPFLALFARLTGRTASLRRLLESLQVDDGPSRRELGWQGEVPLQEGMRRTVAHFLQLRRAPAQGAAS